MDASDCSFEALKLQYDHFLKTLDVFETRQTWAFNFAVVRKSARARSESRKERTLAPRPAVTAP
jgi:hypothetical protein